MLNFSFILSILMTSPVVSGDVSPTIEVPNIIVTPEPSPALPPPAPKPVGKISKSEMYVIQSDVPFVVVASPNNLVSITTEVGPIKVKGLFAGGNGKVETRTFSKKQVVTVESAGTGRVELIIIPVGFKLESEIKRVQLDVDNGQSPQPPPNPVDPVVPDVKPPIDGDGFKVLIVYEAMQTDSLTKSQFNAVFGKTMRDFLDSKCVIGSDGKTREWRIFDKDVDMSMSPDHWAKAMKRDRKSVPWIVISNGKTGFEGPLPETESEIMSLLNKYIK